MANPIGPSFPSELAAAGLAGLPFSWTPAGDVLFDPAMTPAQIAQVQAVVKAHNPNTPAPPAPRVLDALTLATTLIAGAGAPLTKAAVDAALAAPPPVPL